MTDKGQEWVGLVTPALEQDEVTGQWRAVVIFEPPLRPPFCGTPRETRAQAEEDLRHVFGQILSYAKSAQCAKTVRYAVVLRGQRVGSYEGEILYTHSTDTWQARVTFEPPAREPLLSEPTSSREEAMLRLLGMLAHVTRIMESVGRVVLEFEPADSKEMN